MLLALWFDFWDWGADSTAGTAGPVDWRAQEAIHQRDLAKKREQKKREEVISIRVEAQELLLKKRELADATDKQSGRQLRALEKEYARLMEELQLHLAALEQLQQITVKRNRSVIMLLLMASTPFGIIN